MNTQNSTSVPETNTIDAKKAEEKGDTVEKANWGEFIKSSTIGIISTICIGMILIGGSGLYTAKVARAGLIPDNLDLQPYTTIKKVLDTEDGKPVVIYMNPVKIKPFFGLAFWSEPTAIYAQLARFDNDDFLNSFSNGFLCNLEEWAKPGSILSNFWLFEQRILPTMIANTFGIMNPVFNKLNILPEWLIMIVYAILFSLLTYVLFIYNLFTGLILHFKNLSAFFRVADDDGNEWTPDPDYYNLGNMLMFFFVWIMVFIMSIIFTPFFVIIYCLIIPLSAKYTLGLNDKTTNTKSYSFTNFLTDLVTYKETILLVLCIYKLITNTNTYLGAPYMAGMTVGLIILIFVFKIFVILPPTDKTAINFKEIPELPIQPKGIKGAEDPNFCTKKSDPDPDQLKLFDYFPTASTLKSGLTTVKNAVQKAYTGVVTKVIPPSKPKPSEPTSIEMTNTNTNTGQLGGLKGPKKIKHYNVKLI